MQQSQLNSSKKIYQSNDSAQKTIAVNPEGSIPMIIIIFSHFFAILEIKRLVDIQRMVSNNRLISIDKPAQFSLNESRTVYQPKLQNIKTKDFAIIDSAEVEAARPKSKSFTADDSTFSFKVDSSESGSSGTDYRSDSSVDLIHNACMTGRDNFYSVSNLLDVITQL